MASLAGALSGAGSSSALFGVPMFGGGIEGRAARAGVGATLGASLATASSPLEVIGVSSGAAVGSDGYVYGTSGVSASAAATVGAAGASGSPTGVVGAGVGATVGEIADGRRGAILGA